MEAKSYNPKAGSTRLNKKDSDSSSIDETDYRLVVHELRIHQVELEQQNQELRETQQALEESRDQYAQLYDHAPIGYATLSSSGVVTQLNLPCAKLLGKERNTIVGRSLGRFLVASDRMLLLHYLTQVLTTGIRCSLDLHLDDKSAETRVVRLHGERSLSAGIDPVCRVSILDVTEEKRADEKLRESLEEKETLLREIHHRVTNNLQIVTSLLALQANVTEGKDARSALQESQRRVQLMAELHKKLYQSQDLSKFEFGAFLEERLDELCALYGVGERIQLRTQMDIAHLNIDQAVPCAQIVIELVSNSIKHGFPNDRPGTINVRLERSSDRDLVLRVYDDGVGLADNAKWRSTTTLGLKLVDVLSKQIHGQLDLEAGRGTRFRLQFAVT